MKPLKSAAVLFLAALLICVLERLAEVEQKLDRLTREHTSDRMRED